MPCQTLKLPHLRITLLYKVLSNTYNLKIRKKQISLFVLFLWEDLYPIYHVKALLRYEFGLRIGYPIINYISRVFELSASLILLLPNQQKLFILVLVVILYQSVLFISKDTG